MTSTSRVFVQQATSANGQGRMGTPQLAVVSATDSWFTVVNEFVQCCLDDELEIESRPRGMLEGCYVLDAKTLARITDASVIVEGHQYILCISTADLEAFLRLHNVAIPEREPMLMPRESIAMTDTLESLEELSYYFDDAGTLRQNATNRAVSEIVNDERRVEEIDEIVQAAIFHIQMEMLAELNFRQAHLPLDLTPEEPKEAASNVFLTSDWRVNPNLLIVVNGGRGTQPGIWSRDLLIQEGLELGSMLPVCRRAKQAGFAVVVLNPACNTVRIGNDSIPIRGNSTSDEHMLYVWDNILRRSQASNLFFLAFSFGAKLVTTLLQKREEQAVQRVKGIVFAEGAYRLDPTTTSPLIGTFIQQHAINFKGDGNVPLGGHIVQAETDLMCNCLSVGDLAASADPTTSRKGSSNKARTISLCFETAFAFFIAVRDNKCTAAKYVTELETKHRSSLGESVRRRIESLRPGNKRSRNTSEVPNGLPTKRRQSSDASKWRRPSSEASSVSINDFELIKVIGHGSIGKVFLVRKNGTDKIYAMKVLRKRNVVHNGLEESIKTERLILEEIDHPFIARLRFSFQTKDKLYLVTDYCSGGELFFHMTEKGFSIDLSLFYMAELVLGLEHLHDLKVAYRDLKPENILVEASGHLRITDFGLSKMNVVSDEGAQTLVGSPEYLAPEVYAMQPYGYAVDWWSLGVLLYEMLTGAHPFHDENQQLMIQNIMRPNAIQELIPPRMPPDAASLICGLLTVNPAERLGSRGAAEIRSHPFFATVDWGKLLRKEITPPWHPFVQGEDDFSNFDDIFINEPVEDSVSTRSSTLLLNGTFGDFTFNEATIAPSE